MNLWLSQIWIPLTTTLYSLINKVQACPTPFPLLPHHCWDNGDRAFLAQWRRGGTGDRSRAGNDRARAAWGSAGLPPVAAMVLARIRADGCSGCDSCAAAWRVWRRAAQWRSLSGGDGKVRRRPGFLGLQCRSSEGMEMEVEVVARRQGL
jgi:hypothetical protein